MNEFEKDTVELMKHLKEYSLKYGIDERNYISTCVIDDYININNEPYLEEHFDVTNRNEPYETALANG
jgi:hypothetical protein